MRYRTRKKESSYEEQVHRIINLTGIPEDWIFPWPLDNGKDGCMILPKKKSWNEYTEKEKAWLRMSVMGQRIRKERILKNG